MTQTTEKKNLKQLDKPQQVIIHESDKPMSSFELVATGVATGVIASAIIGTGRGIVSLAIRNPIVIFGAGVATGYFARKYRKGILLTASKVAEQGKEFAAQQKKHLDDLLTSDED